MKIQNGLSFFRLSRPFSVSRGLIFTGIVFLALAGCQGPRKSVSGRTGRPPGFFADIRPVILANCSPCHIPSRGGNKKAYDDEVLAARDFGEIMRRISLNPADRGFMPFRKTSKLSDSTIALLLRWEKGGFRP